MPAARNAAASSHKNILISSPLLLYNMVLFANKSTVKYFTCYDEKDILNIEKVRKWKIWCWFSMAWFLESNLFINSVAFIRWSLSKFS